MSSTTKARSSSASGSRKRRSARTERICDEHVRTWLARGFSGCRFAASFASTDQALFSVFDDASFYRRVAFRLSPAATAHRARAA